MPLIPATDSALVPVPDWVSVRTSPNGLSVGRIYSAREFDRELRCATICLIFNGKYRISARRLDPITRRRRGPRQSSDIRAFRISAHTGHRIGRAAALHHSLLDGGAGSGLGQCADRAKLFESRGHIGVPTDLPVARRIDDIV